MKSKGSRGKKEREEEKMVKKAEKELEHHEDKIVKTKEGIAVDETKLEADGDFAGDETDYSGDEPVGISRSNDVIGDLGEDNGDDANIVSFTVAGISRRAGNDPQFQKIVLERTHDPDVSWKTVSDHDQKNNHTHILKLPRHDIADISVFSMKRGACDPKGDLMGNGTSAFSYAYSFRSLFEPDFEEGINPETLEKFVLHDELQKERIESHLALSSLPYTKKDLNDESFLEAVRRGETGC